VRWPRSLFGRLLLLSVLATATALAVAGWTISGVLARAATRGLDDRLDARLVLLTDRVRADGTLDLAGVQRLPGVEPGWAWSVRSPDGRIWTSGGTLAFAPLPLPPFLHGNRPRPAEGWDAAGRPVHARLVEVATSAGAVSITAAAPRHLAERPIRTALLPLLLCLLLLGAALGAAALVQLRLGLRPLRDLREALAQVRAGILARVPGEQPVELSPLADEINALLDLNEAGLAQARGHVANLAHGLKTPLAALAVRLEEPGRDPDRALRALVERADARVRHHLGRARTAAGRTARGAIALEPLARDLVDVLARIHLERAIKVEVAVPPDLFVRIDAEDASEMLGNLLDNSWRFAASLVLITSRVEGKLVRIEVEDDGPGLTDAEIATAMRPGQRLDERREGHGFGLPIARELAELSGGSLELGRGARGGLKVTLFLPRTECGAVLAD